MTTTIITTTTTITTTTVTATATATTMPTSRSYRGPTTAMSARASSGGFFIAWVRRLSEGVGRVRSTTWLKPEFYRRVPSVAR